MKKKYLKNKKRIKDSNWIRSYQNLGTTNYGSNFSGKQFAESESDPWMN